MPTPIVVIAGATGGLGTAIAHEFATQGASCVLLGRNAERLHALAQALPNPAHVVTANIAHFDALHQAAQSCLARFGRIDVVVNAIGADVRKAFVAHTQSDIDHMLDVNLRGAIYLTHAFLPILLTQRQGNIAHLGGFADGRLAFPFYSADVAARAGLRGFVDSLNRELEGSGVLLHYFCPAPADTEAERPYHDLWRKMGTTIETPQAVAASLYRSIQRGDQAYAMGASTRFFAALNSLWPKLADALLMRRYRALLAARFG